jgi:hypothetical protein
LREWEYTCSGLVSFFRIALGGVEVSIRSEDADVVQVLGAEGWWCVVVFAEHVASPGDAGVSRSPVEVSSSSLSIVVQQSHHGVPLTSLLRGGLVKAQHLCGASGVG